MHVTPRSYLTTGIAALGVGAIALSPIQPIPTQVSLAPQRVVSNLAVDLAATVNPFQAWIDTAQTTLDNGTSLLKYYLEQPFPLARTWVSNQVTYVQELFSGNAKLIFPQIKSNIQTLFKAPFDPGDTYTLTNEGDATHPPSTAVIPSVPPLTDRTFISSVPNPESGSGEGSPAVAALLALQIYAGASVSDDYEFWDMLVTYAPVYRFTATLASGLVSGALGPVIAPIASLIESFKAVGANLKAKQLKDALYELINIPANMTNAFFNGHFLDLTKVVEKFAGELVGPIGLNLGGMLNVTPYRTDEVTGATEYNGGVLFDQVGSPPGTDSGFVYDNIGTGYRVGLGGSMVGMGRYLGEQLRVKPVPVPTAAVAPAATVPASVDAAPAVADTPAPAIADTPAVAEEPAAESAPAVSTPARRKAARAAAADNGGTERAGGHSRSARSSR